MNIDIEQLKERIKNNVDDMIGNFPNLAKHNSNHASIKLSFNEQVALLSHLKALEQQQDRINELEKASEWVSVDDRPPEFEVDVWCHGYNQNSNQTLEDRGCYYKNHDGKFVIEFDDYPYHIVTHWKPLPKPPEGKL